LRGTIEKTLKNIGLSEKEAEVYLFLGKRGALKGREITKQLKIKRSGLSHPEKSSKERTC